MSHQFFKELQQEILEIKDRNPHLKPDSAFVAWFMRAFITDDEKQAVDSLTGMAGDKSSDAIHVDHDNRIIFIIQGKYHQNNSVLEPRSPIIALADLGRALMSERKEAFEAILHKANPIVKKQLQDARSFIHNRDYQLVLRYVTTGKISDTNIHEGESRFEDYEKARFETFAFKDLMKLMQDYVEGAAPPVPAISLNVQGTEVFNRIDRQTGITSWIFTMSGDDVGKLFKELWIRLFARNIRGYLGGDKGVNKMIKSTITDEPQFFWYYNNGLTIVCDEARQIKKGTSNIIRVAGGQIINGQQTTRTLANAGKNDAEVLIKLVEVPRDSDHRNNQYRHLVSKIVSATNWQNHISESDLKSNDAEQVRIEKEFKKLGYFYNRKRMSKAETVKYGSDKCSFKVTKEQLGRAVAACNLDPYYVREGKDRLFADDIYSKIFDGRKASEYLLSFWLYKDVEYWSKGNNKYAYAKWHVLNLLWSLLGSELKKTSNRDQFRLMVERRRTYEEALQPLDKIVREAFKYSSLFYSQHKRNEEGKIQEPIDFFKHANLHKSFDKYFEKPSKHKQVITRETKKLLDAIKAATENR